MDGLLERQSVGTIDQGVRRAWRGLGVVLGTILVGQQDDVEDDEELDLDDDLDDDDLDDDDLDDDDLD